jgi:hypothetical protein
MLGNEITTINQNVTETNQRKFCVTFLEISSVFLCNSHIFIPMSQILVQILLVGMCCVPYPITMKTRRKSCYSQED